MYVTPSTPEFAALPKLPSNLQLSNEVINRETRKLRKKMHKINLALAKEFSLTKEEEIMVSCKDEIINRLKKIEKNLVISEQQKKGYRKPTNKTYRRQKKIKDWVVF